MVRNVVRALSVVLISSIIVQSMSASAAERMASFGISSPENVLTSEGTLLNDEPLAGLGSVEMEPAVEANMVGFSAAMDQFFDAISRGDVPASYEVEVGKIVSEEIAAKSVVLDQYENLGIVMVDGYLNVREEPNTEGRIVGKMLNYSACSILGEKNGWYHIKSGEVTGYISADYVVTGDEAISLAMADAKLRAAVINTTELNVRKGPGVEYEAITQITTNERYEVLDVENGWVKIALSSGDYAYVSELYVKVEYSLVEAVKFEPISAETQFRIDIVNYALQFLGNRYVWGGTSLTNGADCSGYMQSVLGHFGVWIPRVSRDQAWAGERISLSELQPGDLVFYGTEGVVNHVAMYIGNGQIVHAISETKGTAITSMWFSSPLCYVNVIGD